MDLLGALFSAGSSLLGGFMNQNNQQQINQQNIQAQEQINAQNIAEQEKFAQQGIQWKAADAKAAGINPLAALGAQTNSFSNVVAPTSSASGAGGQGVADAGQNIARAMQSMQSPADKAVADFKTKMDLESMQLDNDLKRAQLASNFATAHQAGQPPGLPNDPTTESVSFPDRSFSLVPGGGYAVMPSKETQDRSYGMVGEVSSAIRNRLAGFWDPAGSAPPVPLKKGYYWAFNPITGVYSQEPVLFDVPAWWRGK